MFYRLYFFSLKFVGIGFVSSIVSSFVITESSIILARYLPISKLYVSGSQIYYFSHICFLPSHQHLFLFYFWSELHFLPSNLYLHLHDICSVKIFDSFIPVIILKACIFKSSVFLGTNTLSDKSLIVLQLPVNLCNLNRNGH